MNNVINRLSSFWRRDFSTARTVVVIAIIVIFAACGGAKKSDKFPFGSIDIQALSGGACVAPSYIAKELGFFEEEGIDVTLVAGDFESSKVGLSTGKFPIANGDFGFFPAAYNGLDVKLVSGLHQGCIQVLAPPGSDIKTAKDLAGKRIGIDEIGGSPMAVTSVLLANNGIDPQKDVTWLPFPRDVLPTVADNNKEVDAVALWDPWGPLAVQRGYTVLCDINTHPLFAGKYCCFIYASGKSLKENPDQIKAILRAYQKASEWIAKHPEETAKIVIEKDYVSTKDTALLAQLLISYKYHSKHDHTNKLQARNDAFYFSQELQKAGFLPVELVPEEFVESFYFDVFKDEDTGEGHAKTDTIAGHADADTLADHAKTDTVANHAKADSLTGHGKKDTIKSHVKANEVKSH